MSSSGYARNILGAGAGDRPQFNALAFGAITGTTAATANDILTLTRDQNHLKVVNATDVDLILTIRLPGLTSADNVDFDVYRVGATDSFTAFANGDKFPSGTTLAVRRRVGAPTTGEIIVTVK